MRVYEVGTVMGSSRFFGEKREAHDHGKLLMPREDVFVKLVEISTDKETLLTIINDLPFDRQVIKAWTLTRRGALIEDDDYGSVG